MYSKYNNNQHFTYFFDLFIILLNLGSVKNGSVETADIQEAVVVESNSNLVSVKFEF